MIKIIVNIVFWIYAGWLSASPAVDDLLEAVIRADIKAYIEHNQSADSLLIRTELSSLSGLPQYANDNTAIRIVWNRRKTDLIGRVCIPVIILDGDKYAGKLLATVSIQVFRYVCVAGKTLSRHSIVSREDIMVEMREIDKDRSHVLTDPGMIDGKRARRTVRPGRVITEDMLETPPIVRRGETVRIELFYKNLELISIGEAKEDGWKGDLIRVRTDQSVDVVGLVKDNHCVEIQL